MTTYQKSLLLDVNTHTLDLAVEANHNNDRKAAGILSAGSITLGVIGLLSAGSAFLNVAATPRVDQIGLTMAILAFLVIAICYIVELWPRVFDLPLGTDWDDQFDLYINVDKDACYNQVLSNYVKSRESHQELNAIKAKLVAAMLCALAVEITGLLIIVVA